MLAATRDALTAELVARLDEFDRREGWHGWGIRSISHWASINLGLSTGECHRLLGLARGLRGLPQVAEAFNRGALSAAKAHAIVAVATPASQDWWLDIAVQGSASQVARIAAAYVKARQPDEQDPAPLADDRVRTVRERGLPSGLVRVMADLDPDEAAIVRAALESHAEAAWRAGRDDPDEAPPDPYGARLADALVAMAETALAAGPTPCEQGDPHTMVIHVDWDLIMDFVTEGRCYIEGGPLSSRAISVDTALRLACDAAVRVLIERNGQPVAITDDQRFANRRQRRTLMAHHGGCAFPGCGRTRGIHIHHIISWPHGPTVLDNLVPLCRFHHRALHEGGYRITRLADNTLEFRKPDGRIVRPPPPTPPDPSYGTDLDIGPDTPVARSGGGTYDLGLTLDSLFSLR